MIVPTNGGARRTGYPTHAPRASCGGMVQALLAPGRWRLAPSFAGSGTLGAVCAKLGRRRNVLVGTQQPRGGSRGRSSTPSDLSRQFAGTFPAFGC